MKTITINNKTFRVLAGERAEVIYRRYCMSDNYSLTDVYKACSVYKWRAFDRCKGVAMRCCISPKDTISPLKILGANCNTFSCACEIVIDGDAYLLYFTAYHDYIIEL